MIYEAMKDFATNELLPLSQNELNKKDEKLIRKLVEQMGELGFLGIDVPEKYGGSEMTKTGMCILAEGISFCGSHHLYRLECSNFNWFIRNYLVW